MLAIFFTVQQFFFFTHCVVIITCMFNELPHTHAHSQQQLAHSLRARVCGVLQACGRNKAIKIPVGSMPNRVHRIANAAHSTPAGLILHSSIQYTNTHTVHASISRYPKHHAAVFVFRQPHSIAYPYRIHVLVCTVFVAVCVVCCVVYATTTPYTFVQQHARRVCYVACCCRSCCRHWRHRQRQTAPVAPSTTIILASLRLLSRRRRHHHLSEASGVFHRQYTLDRTTTTTTSNVFARRFAPIRQVRQAPVLEYYVCRHVYVEYMYTIYTCMSTFYTHLVQSFSICTNMYSEISIRWPFSAYNICATLHTYILRGSCPKTILTIDWNSCLAYICHTVKVYTPELVQAK